MAVYLTTLLLLSGLKGLDSITTVRQVSVKAGQSVSIPCLYTAPYKNHVKYLCNGYHWNFCTYAIKTDRHNQKPQKFLISDDKHQNIFTVTIQELSNKDTDFWCAVEIVSGADDGTRFHLSVINDTPILDVEDQKVTGFIGENVSIKCNHKNPQEVKWCRLGGQCVGPPSGTINGVVIKVTVTNVSTMTMTNLKPESSGWYWCASRDHQMPVHLTVTKRTTTTGATTLIRDTTASDRSTPVYLKSLIISLSLLITIAIVALTVWFLLRCRKKTKAEESATSKMELEVTYSDVKSSVQAEDNVTYSSVVHVKQNSAKVGENYDSTIYSTVAQLHHDI